MSERGLWRRGLLLLLLPTLWLMGFLVIPSFMMGALAFTHRTADGGIEWVFTFGNIERLLGFDSVTWALAHWSPTYMIIMLRSLGVAFTTTLISLVLAYPLAFFIANQTPRMRYFWMLLITIPICTNLVIRIYAWMLILGAQSPFTLAMRWLGLIGEHASLYPGAFAVQLAMVSCSLPFTVLPIYTNVERLDWSIVEAARDLYANNLRIFFHAILPQTLPGLVVSTILTLIPALGMFVASDLLGGSKFILVGNLIQLQFGASRNWPFGSAVSLGLMLVTLIGLLIIQRRSFRNSVA